MLLAQSMVASVMNLFSFLLICVAFFDGANLWIDMTWVYLLVFMAIYHFMAACVKRESKSVSGKKEALTLSIGSLLIAVPTWSILAAYLLFGKEPLKNMGEAAVSFVWLVSALLFLLILLHPVLAVIRSVKRYHLVRNNNTP